MAVLTANQLTRLKRMAGESHKSGAARMLTDEVLDDIASEVALVKDADGLTPVDADYTTTVDLYRAAAEAWRTKAGMVAEGFDFEAEGGVFDRSQVYKHYLDQAARYAGMAGNLSPQTGRPVEESADANAFEEWLEGGGG